MHCGWRLLPGAPLRCRHLWLQVTNARHVRSGRLHLQVLQLQAKHDLRRGRGVWTSGGAFSVTHISVSLVQMGCSSSLLTAQPPFICLPRSPPAQCSNTNGPCSRHADCCGDLPCDATLGKCGVSICYFCRQRSKIHISPTVYMVPDGRCSPAFLQQSPFASLPVRQPNTPCFLSLAVCIGCSESMFCAGF